MAWDLTKAEAPSDPKRWFKPTSEIEETTGLKMSVWGGPEVGKTFFLCSCPPPVYIIDTEFGASKVAKRHFPTKEIQVFEVRIAEQDFETIDYWASINEIEKALYTLKDIKTGTIGIDSVTDIYSWLNAWVEQTATKKVSTKTGTEYIDRLEWQKRNERYRNLVVRLLAKPCHVVFTAQPKTVYTRDGKETDEKEPKWLEPHEHWSDIVIKIQKLKIEGKLRYAATVTKCREERALDMTIEDITFDKLVARLNKDLNLKVKSYGVSSG